MQDKRLTKRLFWLFLCILLLLIINLWFQLRSALKNTRLSITSENQQIAVEDVGCDIPQFQETQIKKYIVPRMELKCEGEPYWVCIEPGRVRVCPEATQKHQGIRCTYTFIIRIDDYTNINGSSINAGTEYVALQSDFFHVNCTANDGKKWSNIMAGIHVQLTSPTETPSKGLGLNVLIWGFDSLSRLQFIRGLPKTYKYLSTNQNAVILTGYNKVGEGTAMAFIPMLTGKMENELPVTQRKMGRKANFVNVYPFIWNDFKEAGYVTAYGEDGVEIGTFNYRLKGFDASPTDHYFRPYYISARKYFHTEKPFCLRRMLRHKIMMKWIEDLYDAYPKKLKFSLTFHSEYSHTYDKLIGNADDDLLNFLSRFHNNTYLNNTLLIVMSDHGYRFAKINDKLQRRREERMPFMSLVFPKWFEDKYPQAMANLRINAERLTTPFDIHSTLRSVLNFERPRIAREQRRGISLFNEIPITRNCIDAGIALFWCVCIKWKEMPSNNKNVIAASAVLLNEINRITAAFRDVCEKLSLQKVTWGYQFQLKKAEDVKYLPEEYLRGHSVRLEDHSVLLIQLEAAPQGHFEALIIQHDKTYDVLIDSILRKDMYKLTSGCLDVTFEYLHKFCICRNI